MKRTNVRWTAEENTAIAKVAAQYMYTYPTATVLQAVKYAQTVAEIAPGVLVRQRTIVSAAGVSTALQDHVQKCLAQIHEPEVPAKAEPEPKWDIAEPDVELLANTLARALARPLATVMHSILETQRQVLRQEVEQQLEAFKTVVTNQVLEAMTQPADPPEGGVDTNVKQNTGPEGPKILVYGLNGTQETAVKDLIDGAIGGPYTKNISFSKDSRFLNSDLTDTTIIQMTRFTDKLPRKVVQKYNPILCTGGTSSVVRIVNTQIQAWLFEQDL